MKTIYTLGLYTLVLTSLLAAPSGAQETEQTTGDPAVQDSVQDSADFGPVMASDVVLEDLMFLRRPVVVFADSPADPTFVRQMQLIERDLPALAERDVALIIDTDPAAKSAIRQRLRPRGFSLVLMDKDLRPVIRKPLPWDVREIVAAIDKFPLRRQEILDRQPSGR
ncbi:DUF4174 domain-containing protein [Tabrizicola sp.]|uniref:DUF4174 domain-containing protein n=1 Tax=Tabrizicola sp. TaxID=2005166 RepID=UPI003D2B06E8